MRWFTHRENFFEPTEEGTRKILPLYEGDRGILDLSETNAELRIWIPEPLKLAMREVTDHLDKTISIYLREFFVIYLYGVHDLICMIENNTGIFYVPPPEPKKDCDISFSRTRSIEFIPGLGKNIIPLKIFLNIKIKEDLKALAEKAGMPLSQFIREILVSHFLGHTLWAERELLFSPSQQVLANGWENGDEITEYHRPSNDEDVTLEGVVEKIYL